MAEVHLRKINTSNIGKKFEDQVYYDWLLKKYPNHIIEKNVYFDELGIELDFVGIKSSGKIDWVAEAKGGESAKWNKGGGARRTDNTKKALNNISFIKKQFPKVKTYCFFTYEPKKGNSVDIMLKKAIEWKWLDEIVYILPTVDKTIFDEFYG